MRWIWLALALGLLFGASPGQAQRFFSVRPCRLLDTRPSATPLVRGVTRILNVGGSCGIPADANAVALNVVVTQQTAEGWLNLFPAGASPGAVTFLNFQVGENLANNGIIELSNGGQIGIRPALFGDGTVHVIVDVTGYFGFSSTPAPGAEGPFQFHPLDPCRLDYTANSGGPLQSNLERRFKVRDTAGCGVPFDAGGAALNMTAIQPSTGGHIIVWPTDGPMPNPGTSSINVPAARNLANGMVTGLGAGGDDLAFLYQAAGTATTNLALDVNGYFHREGGTFFAPMQCRAVDTRVTGGPLTNGIRYFNLRETCGIRDDSQAVLVNVVIVSPTGSGRLTLFPGDVPLPGTSTINFLAGEGPLANGTIVRLGEEGTWGDLAVDFFSGAPATVHVVMDVYGTFSPPGLITARSGTGGHVGSARGFSPTSAFQSEDIDSVNLLNGNLTVTVPIGHSYPVGGGLGYQLNLVYNSKIWDFDYKKHQGRAYGAAVPHRLSNAGIGWTLSLGRLLDPDDVENTHGDEGQPGGWIYVDASGAEHVFYDVLNAFECVGGSCGRSQPSPGVLYSRDGSYLRLRDAGGGFREVQFPNGDVHVFEPHEGSLRLVTMRNRFVDGGGNNTNTVNIGYLSNPERWVITDSHQRTHTIRFRSDPSGTYPRLVETVTLATFGGGSAPYQFSYNTKMVPRSCANTWPFYKSGLVELPVLTGIVRPDGSSFTPTHFASNPATCHGGGLLARLDLPTGGRFEYDYREYSLPTEACGVRSWRKNSAGVGQRRIYNGSALEGAWSYVPSLSNGPIQTGRPLCPNGDYNALAPEQLKNTVTSPAGDKTVHYFSVFPGDAERTYSGPFLSSEYGLPFTRMSLCAPPGGGESQPCASAPPGSVAVNPKDGRFLSWEAMDCAGSACPVRRRGYSRYEGDGHVTALMANHCAGAPLDEGCQILQWRVASDRTVFVEDAAGTLRQSGTDRSNFDGLGHYRRSDEVDDFVPSQPIRTTDFGFNPDRGRYHLTNGAPTPSGSNDQFTFTMVPPWAPWVLTTYDSHKVTQGGHSEFTAFCFDGSTGFLDRRRIFKRGIDSWSPVDVVIAYGKDAAGNVTAEAYHGGDGANLGSGKCNSPESGLTNAAYFLAYEYQFGGFKSARYQGSNGENLANALDFLTIDNSMDRNTGLAASSTDSSGVATTLEYDQLGRLTWIRPQTSQPGQPSFGDGWTEHQYLRAGHVNSCGGSSESSTNAMLCVRRRGSGGTGVLAESQFVFDGLGRLWRERIKLPDNTWNLKETLYNTMGWVASESQPGSSARVEYEEYDAFGRPLSVKPPDGAAHRVTYAYAGARTRSRTVSMGVAQSGDLTVEQNVTQTEIYDGRGRLVFVRQPVPATDCSGAAGLLESQYDYDQANRLVSVQQRSQTSTGSVCRTQQRSFAYDGRGFVISENHPEKTDNVYPGTLANDVDYLDHDARGHARRIVDGVNDLQYDYDRAERLTAVWDWASGKALKGFVYGALASGGNRSLGKLAQDVRHNYPFGLTSSTVVPVTQSYVYGGRGGRVSSRATTASSVGPFTQTVTYDALGSVESMTYPTCTSFPCSGVSVPSGVTNQYTNGFLSAVFAGTNTTMSPFATNISYHSNQAVKRVRLANNVDWQQDVTNGLRRPSHICLVGATDGRTCGEIGGNLGPYRYDGAGNVVQAGGEDYLYDPLGRVMKGVIGSGEYQSYNWDLFGNITSVTTCTLASGGVCSNLVTRNVPAQWQSNRLAWPASYDAGGNQLGWGSQVYQYDSFDQLRQLQGGGNDWVYAYTADDQRVISWDRVTGLSSWRLRDLEGRLVREYRQQNTQQGDVWSWAKDYFYRGNQLLGSDSPAGKEFYYLDHLGSPRVQRNASGSVVATHHYFPFGEEAVASADSEPMRFTGHERDFNAGAGTIDDLDYMHARYYHPLNARFSTTDPAAGDPRQPQTWHRYLYARGNPMAFIDPDGRLERLVVPPTGIEVLLIPEVRDAMVDNWLEQYSNTGLMGVGLNVSGPLAFDLTAALAVNLQGGDVDIAVSASSGGGTAGAGIEAFGGAVQGPIQNVSGPSVNVNGGLGLGSGTVFTQNGRPTGGVAGPSLSVPSASASVTMSETRLVFRDIVLPRAVGLIDKFQRLLLSLPAGPVVKP